MCSLTHFNEACICCLDVDIYIYIYIFTPPGLAVCLCCRRRSQWSITVGHSAPTNVSDLDCLVSKMPTHPNRQNPDRRTTPAITDSKPRPDHPTTMADFIDGEGSSNSTLEGSSALLTTLVTWCVASIGRSVGRSIDRKGLTHPTITHKQYQPARGSSISSTSGR